MRDIHNRARGTQNGKKRDHAQGFNTMSEVRGDSRCQRCLCLIRGAGGVSASTIKRNIREARFFAQYVVAREYNFLCPVPR